MNDHRKQARSQKPDQPASHPLPERRITESFQRTTRLLSRTEINELIDSCASLPTTCSEALPRADLEGNLSFLSVGTILSFLENACQSGILEIRSHDVGRIFVKWGQVLDAEVSGNRRLVGAEAVYEMLTWTDGDFGFSRAEIDVERTIHCSISSLLLDMASRVNLCV